ncbi:uncharacterized protein [Apostichopus japonicus]|uniref:uncharacterized protein isoform X2 n=1 Tax=Stichopus japonicus TaxID=307972 RepID=UPI003AB75E70
MAMSRDDSDASGGVFNHPLFPAGGNSRAGSFEEPLGRKQRETRGVNQPFWSVMTQPSGSPLQAQSSDNVNRRSQPSNDGLDFEAIKEEIKSKFQRMQESGNSRSVGSDQNTNEKQVASFEYNHGKRIGGGPIRFPGVQKPFRQGPTQGNQGMGPKALMEVTIPNPAALFHKFNEKMEGESKSGSVRKEVQTDRDRPSEQEQKGRDSGRPSKRDREGRDPGRPSDREQGEKDHGRPSDRAQEVRGCGKPSEQFQGGKDRVIIPENEQTGRDHGRRSEPDRAGRDGRKDDNRSSEQERSGRDHSLGRRGVRPKLDVTELDLGPDIRQTLQNLEEGLGMMPCPPGIGPFDGPAMFGNDPVRFEQPPFGMGPDNMMNMNNAPGSGNFMMPGPFGPQGPQGPLGPPGPGPQWPLDFPGEMPAMGPFMDGPQMMGPRFPFPNRPTDFRNDQVQGMKRKVTGNQQKSNRAKQRKRSNSESKTQTKPTKEVKKVTPVLEYNAESLKLMDQIARGSKPHQLALIKKIGINEKFENRDLLPWMCYLCDQENDTWQEYVNHCKSTKHKSQAIGLGTTLKKEEKARVHNAFKKLPFTGVSFSIGRTQAGDKASGGQDTEPSTLGIKERSAGLQECKPCGRFFMLKDRLQNHLKSEGHQKRETFLKQRYGNSWLEYYWYNQSKPRERGDAEPMGVAFVLPVSGYFCKLCSKFYNSEITAKDVHCRSDSHIEKVKEWDREQLTKKDSVSMKVKQSDIEAAVKETDQQRKNTRWQPAKITLDTSTIFLVDSDEENESQEYDGKQVTTDRQSEKKPGEDKKSIGGKEREEDLEEGELSERDVLKMEKQQQEDRIREEYQKREERKRERILREQREKERKEQEKREKEQKERERKNKEKREKERKEQERRLKEWKEKEERERLERERKERELREREMLVKQIELKNKLEKEKIEIERKERELQEQLEGERREKEKREKERQEQEERERKTREEMENRIKQEEEQKLREAQQLEMVQLENRIRQQEMRECELMEERQRLRQMLAVGAINPAVAEIDLRDREIREKLVRDQLGQDRRKLEGLRQAQQSDASLRTTSVLNADAASGSRKDALVRREQELQMKERELIEIEKREAERRRIEEKEKEMLDHEKRQQMRELEIQEIRKLEQQARREDELQARQEQEMQARREQEMQARKQQEMQVRRDQEMQLRQEQEMQARREQEMQARKQQEMQVRRDQEMQLRQEQEMQAKKEQEMQARRNHEMQARREQEELARREQEMLARQTQEMQQTMREQEIQEMQSRREQDIQDWLQRENHMLSKGVRETEVLQQRHLFQQELEQRYQFLEAIKMGERSQMEMVSPGVERVRIMEQLFKKGKGELMIQAVVLQKEGYTDDQIKVVMVREEELLKQRVMEEVRRMELTDDQRNERERSDGDDEPRPRGDIDDRQGSVRGRSPNDRERKDERASDYDPRRDRDGRAGSPSASWGHRGDASEGEGPYVEDSVGYDDDDGSLSGGDWDQQRGDRSLTPERPHAVRNENGRQGIATPRRRRSRGRKRLGRKRGGRGIRGRRGTARRGR